MLARKLMTAKEITAITGRRARVFKDSDMRDPLNQFLTVKFDDAMYVRETRSLNSPEHRERWLQGVADLERLMG